MPPNNQSDNVQVEDYLVGNPGDTENHHHHHHHHHHHNLLDYQQQMENEPESSGFGSDDESKQQPQFDELSPSIVQSIDEFYSNQNIFITGGTGFVGKVLIEKLLYEFESIGIIYIMLRPKSGQLIQKRLEEMLNGQVFDRIRTKYPERLKKLQAISGDIRFPGMGINPLDLEMLKQKVSIIFHSAATIRFDEPLKYALTINTLGTKRVVQLAKKLQNLRAFVHVSTAYCTVDKKNIEEKVYYEPISPDKILEMADWMDDATMNRLAETLYRGRPCSYHYTKSLAEHLLAQEVSQGYFQSVITENQQQAQPTMPTPIKQQQGSCANPTSSINNTHRWRPFPVAIVRPSIITPSWKDPFPGWIDNYNGTTGFLVVSGKGVLRSMHVQKDYQCDLIPVDVVINTCILSAWYVATYHYTGDGKNINGKSFPSTLTEDETPDITTTGEDVFVVNCVSGILNPITWSQIRDISMPLMYKYPSMEMFRLPGVRYHQSQLFNKINVYLEHTVPAFVVDFLFKFMGLSPILNQVYQKVHRATAALEFFTTNEWTYTGTNMLLLYQALHHCSQFQNENQKLKPNFLKFDQDKNQLLTNSISGDKNLDNYLKRFPINLGQLKWKDYFRDYVLGIRKYLLKEDPATIPQAQTQLFMMYTLTMMGKILMTGTICYQLLYPNSIIRKSWQNFLTARQHNHHNNKVSTMFKATDLLFGPFSQRIK